MNLEHKHEVYTLSKKMCHQGELTIIRVDGLPKDLNVTETELDANRNYIIGHSETGHHHTISSKLATAMEDKASSGFTCYLKIDGEYADLVHHRTDHRHGTVRLPTGTYKINRQREYTPEGEKLAAD